MLRANKLEVIDYCWNLQAASSSDTHVPQSTVWISTHIICCAYSESLNCNRPHRPHILHHPDKFLSHESSYGLAFSACSDLCFLQRHSHTLPVTHQQISHPVPHLSWGFAEGSVTTMMLKHFTYTYLTLTVIPEKLCHTLRKLEFSKNSQTRQAFLCSTPQPQEHGENRQIF